MRRFVLLSLSTLLLTAGCDKDAPKGDDKAQDPAKAKAAQEGAKAEAAASAAAPEAKADAKAEPKEETYGDALCDAIIPCFESMKFVGNFAADVTADIEPDGSVSAVSFTGEAPKPVQTCITTGIEAMKIEPYNGKPGRVHCQKSGQLMGGGQMIMSDHSYEIRDSAAPPDAKADAPAEDAKAG